jgi:hypothetical protein
MNPETGNRSLHGVPIPREAVDPSDLTLEVGTRGASAPQPHRKRDLTWELLYWCQTLRPYEPGAPLTEAERGKINKAAAEVKASGYSVDDLRLALSGWPMAMGNCRVTPRGLLGNLTRCMNAAKGAQSMVEMTDVERALRAWEGDHR